MEDILPSLGRAGLYLGIPFVLMIFWFQWKWAKDCNKYIRVLVAQKSGGGAYRLAPKEGGEITITNPIDGSTRTWPVNELATIEVPYPGVGFVPAFMQKTIRMAIVSEGDWEPMLNRSPHRANIASPDVVKFLQELCESADEDTKKKIEAVVGNLATGPTREMVADPSLLGSLMKSGVMKALATVSDDFLDILKSVNMKLGKVVGPNPMVVYIGLGLILILAGFVVYTVMPLAADLAAVKNALGVSP